MIRLVFAIICSLLLVYFAVQNTVVVPRLMFAGYAVTDTPLYIVVIGSLLLGLGIGLVFYFLQMVSTSLSTRAKDKDLKAAEKQIVALTKRVHELELENAQVVGEDEDEKSL